MILGMLACMCLLMSLCIFTVSYTLLRCYSDRTLVVPVSVVLFTLCNVVSVEWFNCCVVMCGILFVIYESMVFSSIVVNAQRRGID